MRKTIYSLFILWMCLSCKVENPLPYSEPKPSVYFNITSDISNTIVKSFIAVIQDSLIVNVPITISGIASDKDRYFKVTIDTSTTAKVGVDYEALKDNYVVKAGEYTSFIPIKLRRTPYISTNSLKIVLNLKESDDFNMGVKTQLQATVLFSDRLDKPSNWSTAYFYAYSRIKHRVFLNITGLTEYPTNTEFTANFQYYSKVVSRAMSNYFRDQLIKNTPAYDDNGVVIQPW